MTNSWALVYQCGIANLFDRHGKRVKQGAYNTCELIAYGLVLAGEAVEVYHSDVAGDVAASTAPKWKRGKGELWAEQKHPPLESIGGRL